MLPISLSLPWILNVGDLLGHLPLPAKITIEVGQPIDLREQFGPEPDVDEVYDYVTRVMQETLDGPRRRAPLPGDRLMRLNESIVISASPKLGLGLHRRARRTRCTSWPGSPAGRSRASSASGLGARYRMLMRVGSAEIGGLIEVVEFTEPLDMAWSSVTGVDQRGRWRLRRVERRPHPGRVSLRLRRRRRRDHRLHLRAGRRAVDPLATCAAPSKQLKRQVEHERQRQDAAARRAEREAANA